MTETMAKPRFSLGQVVATPGALALCTRAARTLFDFSFPPCQR